MTGIFTINCRGQEGPTLRQSDLAKTRKDTGNAMCGARPLIVKVTLEFVFESAFILNDNEFKSQC